MTPGGPARAPQDPKRPPLVGVLGLQGDVAQHLVALGEVGASGTVVRRPGDLVGLDALVIPGGESTTLSLLLESSGLAGALGEALEGGLTTFGTCAGLVVLARAIEGGRPDQVALGAVDCVVRRNAYGRQAQSFETFLDASGIDAALARYGHQGPEAGPMPAVFIRAPQIEAVGEGVEVLVEAQVSSSRHGAPVPVVARQGQVLVAAFHPELTSDRRLHRLVVAMAASAGTTAQAQAGATAGAPSEGAATGQ